MAQTRRFRGSRRQKAAERRGLLLLLAFGAIAAAVPIGLMVHSTRPDLYSVRPPASAAHVTAINWRELRSALESAEPPHWLAGEVEIAGFAFATQAGSAAFRLVPSAGDWLHPPHFHHEETIDVHLPEPLTERPGHRATVRVRGRIVRGALAAPSGGIQMKAAGWRRWEQPPR